MSPFSKQVNVLAVLVVVWMIAGLDLSPADANLVSNGDFSANAASFTTAPGYAAPWSAGNPASLPGWTYTVAGLWGVNGTLAGLASVFGPTDKSATSTWAFRQRPGGFPDAGTLTQVVPLAANSTYSFSHLAAARIGENASGRVTIADNSTTYYDSGSTLWSNTAFQLVSTVFNTGNSIDGPVVLKLSSTAALAQSVSHIPLVHPARRSVACVLRRLHTHGPTAGLRARHALLHTQGPGRATHRTVAQALRRSGRHHQARHLSR